MCIQECINGALFLTGKSGLGNSDESALINLLITILKCCLKIQLFGKLGISLRHITIREKNYLRENKNLLKRLIFQGTDLKSLDISSSLDSKFYYFVVIKIKICLNKTFIYKYKWAFLNMIKTKQIIKTMHFSNIYVPCEDK